MLAYTTFRDTTHNYLGFGSIDTEKSTMLARMDLGKHNYQVLDQQRLEYEPEKCKESVFEAPILLQNQANPQIL